MRVKVPMRYNKTHFFFFFTFYRYLNQMKDNYPYSRIRKLRIFNWILGVYLLNFKSMVNHLYFKSLKILSTELV